MLSSTNYSGMKQHAKPAGHRRRAWLPKRRIPSLISGARSRAEEAGSGWHGPAMDVAMAGAAARCAPSRRSGRFQLQLYALRRSEEAAGIRDQVLQLRQPMQSLAAV